MSVDETEETLTDPKNRTIHQVTVNDMAQVDKLFDDLMGQAITPRKEFIKKYSKGATDLV